MAIDAWQFCQRLHFTHFLPRVLVRSKEPRGGFWKSFTESSVRLFVILLGVAALTATKGMQNFKQNVGGFTDNPALGRFMRAFRFQGMLAPSAVKRLRVALRFSPLQT